MILKFTTPWLILATSILVSGAIASTRAQADTTAVEPAATRTLKRMTEYLGGLKQFSVHTENTVEDVLDSGQRIDEMVSADVVVKRPNKLRVERRGDLPRQTLYYDGKHLTLYEPGNNVFATVTAPPTLERTIAFARNSLGLNVPAADMINRNGYALLLQDVTSASVIGKSVVDGVECTHLTFQRPGVEFQIWVADTGPPLPYRYVVTDSSATVRISVTTVMSKWNTAPDVADASFTFVPPKGASSITFSWPGASGAANQ